MGAAAFTGAIPDTPRRRRDGPGLPDRGVQRARRRRRLHVRPAQGLARPTRTGRPRSNTPMPAAPSPSRATAAPRPIRPGRSCSSSSSAASSEPALRKDAELEQIHWSTNRLQRLAGDAGLRLRPPHAARGGRRRARRRRATGSAPSSSSACRPRREVAARPARLRHPLRRPARARRALRRRRHRPLDRPAGRAARAAGRCGSRPRSSPTTARRSPNGRSSTWSRCSAFYHPDDDARDEGRAGGDRRPALPRRPRQPAGVPAGDHPLEGRAGRPTPPRPRSSSASTTSASIPTGGSSSR